MTKCVNLDGRQARRPDRGRSTVSYRSEQAGRGDGSTQALSSSVFLDSSPADSWPHLTQQVAAEQ